MLLVNKVAPNLSTVKSGGGDLSFYLFKAFIDTSRCIMWEGDNQCHVPRIIAFIYIISLFMILETIQPIKKGVRLTNHFSICLKHLV